MKLKLGIIATASFLTLLFFSPFLVLADGSCQPIYGGGQTCVPSSNIVLNKTVMNPQTASFVDNLGMNDPKYAPGQEVTFKLNVTNTGDSSLNNINISDIFPQFVDFVSGPGNFDSATRNLTFKISRLSSNETQTFTVVGKVSSAVSQDNNIVCVVNQAVAVADNGSQAQDNAQFCIQKTASNAVPTTTKGGLPILPPSKVTTTPPTGPEALPLLALLPTGFLGALLRKKSK